MSIKKQLQKFYAKQGLEGKHLRKAIQWDMKAARRNTTKSLVGCAWLTLDSAFTWHDSPEGRNYWAVRCGWQAD